MDSRLKENVETLINIIEEDMNANQSEMTEKIPGFIQDYKKRHDGLVDANSQLEQQINSVTKAYTDNRAKEQEMDE